MKILLDECVDRRLATEIEGHEVVTVPQAGWAGIQNGELLRLAQAQFDVFVTVDRNLSLSAASPAIHHRRHRSSGADQSLDRPSTLGAPTPPNVAGGSKRSSDLGQFVVRYACLVPVQFRILPGHRSWIKFGNRHLRKRVLGVTGHGVPACCVTLSARLFVNRFTMNLRLSSAINSTRAPSASGPKIQTGKGLVPKIALPQGV